jgi:hypothetical protein
MRDAAASLANGEFLGQVKRVQYFNESAEPIT